MMNEFSPSKMRSLYSQWKDGFELEVTQMIPLIVGISYTFRTHHSCCLVSLYHVICKQYTKVHLEYLIVHNQGE